MKKALIAIVLATSIQGGFAALDNDNPLTNPDLPPKVRAQLESRILEWLCPRIKMTASNYIRSRLYPLSGSLTASLSFISASSISPSISRSTTWHFDRGSSRGSTSQFSRGSSVNSMGMYVGPPLYTRYFFNRPKLQSWLEQLTPSQTRKLDDALMVSIIAYLKTHPNDFMVSCYIENNDQNNGGGSIVIVSTINADVGDTISIQLSPSNSNQAVQGNAESVPDGTWSTNDFFSSKCLVKRFTSYLSTGYWWDCSSVTYSHGGATTTYYP